jgi:hypothetical protein
MKSWRVVPFWRRVAGKMLRKKTVWYHPKHRYIDELGMYDHERQAKDIERMKKIDRFENAITVKELEVIVDNNYEVIKKINS